jgi:signal transduction histidine kinase
MREQIKQQFSKEMHALTEVAKTLTKPLDLPELLDAILQKLIGTLEPAEIGAVMLWDQSEGVFWPAAAFGYDLKILKEINLREGESVTGKVFNEGVACLWRNPEDVGKAMEDMQPDNRDVMARSLGVDLTPICTLASPITVDENKFGVLVLETLEGPAVFSDDDIPFVQSLADLIALAIERARLINKSRLAREAREAGLLRAELTATLSHELRLPLSAIKGYSTALLIKDVDWDARKQNEFLALIVEECEHMEGMLSDILDSSLISVDQLTLEPEPVRLHYMAREVSKEIQLRTEIHHIIVDLSPDLPMVAADQRWVKQVFRNLLDNAVKYSPDGGLVVIRGHVRSAEVVISISDQGVGISPEEMVPLFEKFHRTETTTKPRIPGTGIGLPFSRAIVEAHGGQIWAESKKGQGTTMSFTLPIWDSTEA